MGSRGAFVNIDTNDFSFINGGQIYKRLNSNPNDEVEYLIQEGKGGVKVPDYSHSPNKIYAVIQMGEVKSIGIYENHIKVKSIDLLHNHFEKTLGITLKYHYHTDLNHKEPAHPLDDFEIRLVEKVIKGARKYL